MCTTGDKAHIDMCTTGDTAHIDMCTTGDTAHIDMCTTGDTAHIDMCTTGNTAHIDMCTTLDTAHIYTIFKLLPHTRQHGCIDILHCCNDTCLFASEFTWQWWEEYPIFDISQDVMSGDLGGHSESGWSFPGARPIQRPGKTVFKC